MPDNEPMGYWDSLDKGIDLENEYREQRAAGQVESEENPEIQAQAVEPVEPVEGEEKDEFSDVGDVVSMSQRSVELLLQPKLYQTISFNAHETAQKYAMHKIVPLYEKCYQEALK